MSRFAALAIVLALAAPRVAGADPIVRYVPDVARLYSATVACIIYESRAERRECDQVPALIKRVKAIPPLRPAEEQHHFMVIELGSRALYGAKARRRVVAAVKAAGTAPARVAAADEANFRDGLALINGDLARPGHGHAVAENLAFLLEAAYFHLTLRRYGLIDPWLARVRAEMQAELEAAPPGAEDVAGRNRAARVARLAGQIETGWSASLAARASSTAAGGDADAAARHSAAAAEAEALALRWQARADALEGEAGTD